MGRKIVDNLFRVSVFLPHRRLAFLFTAWKEVKVCLFPVEFQVLIFVINPSKQFQEGKANPLHSHKLGSVLTLSVQNITAAKDPKQ